MNDKCNIINCDVYQGIQKIKSRYTGAFIYSLIDQDKQFKDLEAEFSYISSTQVSRTLKQLIQNGLVINQNNAYSLTPAAIELVPILDLLETWNEKYFNNEEKEF